MFVLFLSRNKINHVLLKVILFCLVLFCFWLSITVNFDKADPYLTDKYYYYWLDSILELLSTGGIGLNNIISTSALTIKSPEPISHIIAIISVYVFDFEPSTILAIYSVLLVSVFCCSLDSRKDKLFIQLFLLIFMVMFSYYWFVLFNITHRLKIAWAILSVSFYLSDKRPKLATLFLVLSVFTHYTILLIIPIIYTINRERYISPIVSAYLFVKYMFVISILIYLVIIMYANGEQYTTFLMLLSGKFGDFKIYSFSILPAILSLMFILKKIEKSFIYPNRYYFVALFYLISFYIIGPSRLLMLVSITLSMVVFYNPNLIYIRNRGKVNVIFPVVIIVFLYDFFKSIQMYFGVNVF